MATAAVWGAQGRGNHREKRLYDNLQMEKVRQRPARQAFGSDFLFRERPWAAVDCNMLRIRAYQQKA